MMLRRDLWRLAGAAAALCWMGSGAQASVTPTGELSAESKSAITQKLDEAVQRGDAPGLVALIVDRDGALYEAAAGKADLARGTPMRTDALFAIASMTKPVTSVAIMQLFEQGKIKLDDPVSKYLPGFDNLRVYRSPGSMSWAGIFNTEFWIDPKRHVGGVLMMQMLPFYDDGAIRTLREFESTAYKELR